MIVERPSLSPARGKYLPGHPLKQRNPPNLLPNGYLRLFLQLKRIRSMKLENNYPILRQGEVLN
jgi:hypothetical protein